MRNGVLFLLLLTSTLLPASSVDHAKLKSLFDAKDFFALRDAVATLRPSSPDYLFYRGVVRSKFAQVTEAAEDLRKFIESVEKHKRHPMLRAALEELAEAQSRGYRYAAAYETYKRLLGERRTDIRRKDKSDYENMLTMLAPLKDVPPIEVEHRRPSSITGTLSDIPMKFGKHEIKLGFDTGADLSIITASLAKEFGFRVFDAKVEVGNVAGLKVNAHMGLAPEITIGNATVRNAVFLVFEDKDLFVPPDFQIHGIIGLPIISALGRVTAHKEGRIELAPSRDQLAVDANLCYEHLKLVLQAEVNGKRVPFVMDTGASSTSMYQPFERAFRKALRFDKTKPHKEQGIGGYRMIKNLTAKNVELKIGVVSGTFASVPVLLQETQSLSKTLYGNLGIDLVKQFKSWTFDFGAMKITAD